jgi:hypothetical protein
MANVPEGQMCELGCGRKALHRAMNTCEIDKDGNFRSGLYTCQQCGADVRGGVFDAINKKIDDEANYPLILPAEYMCAQCLERIETCRCPLP